MNAERLHAILREVKKELEGQRLVELLQQLQGQVQNLSNQPQNAQFQQAVGQMLSTVEKTLESARSNAFSPAWREALKELGIDELLGESVAQRIRGIVEKNQVLTPAIATQQVQEIVGSIVKLKTMIDQTTQGLTNFKIGAEDLGPGECEIGILIPRSAVENKLGQFADELKEFEFIISQFSELCTGGLHPNFPPFISRVRRLFRPSWGVLCVASVSSSSQFFRPPFTL